MIVTLLWYLGVHFEVLDHYFLLITASLIEGFYPCRGRLRRYGRERSNLAIRKQRVQGRVRLGGGDFYTENRRLWHVEALQPQANLQQKFLDRRLGGLV